MFDFSIKYNYVLNNFDVSNYLEQAEKILENKLIFIHPWDMERTSTYYNIPKNWNELVNEDEEWIFMRSRMNYFDPLFLSYEKSKDIKYINKIKEIIFDFINKHKKLKYELSTRTLDSGIRMVNILKSIIYLKEINLISKDEEDKIVKHLDDTCTYLFDAFVEKYFHSNWGYIQMAGIYTFGLMYNKKYAKRAKKYMKKQLEIQFLSDGLHIEKSMTYHYQMLIYTAWIVMIERLYDIKNSLFLKYLRKMVDSAQKLHYPNLRQINFGDSDDDNIEDILSMANAILKRKSKYMPKETSYMFAGSFLDDYEVIENILDKKEYFLKESGYYHLINKDYSFSTYLTNMTSGHLHVDLFHFNYFNKVEMLVDKGRYTYLEKNEDRNYLKSVRSHNSLVIDDKEFLNIKNSWEYSGNYPIINPMERIEENGVVSLKLSAFDIDANAYIERRYILCEDNVIIINRIYTKGKHKVKFYYNLHPKLSFNLESKRILLNKEIYFEIGKYIIDEGIYSSKYNEKENNKVVMAEYEFVDKIQVIHKILNKGVMFEEIESDENIYSFKITTKDKKYNIFCKNEDSIEKQNVSYIQSSAIYNKFKVEIK
ncbi:heparinase II/III family protein [Streptobacillus felis]|uniref:heparinase II/III family protein n=1 Tax=Streptobacillus felis TaxID=1384509 RepID=UPI00082F9D41|nr:heparinase II/III family protein [Streptobacillus felis]